VAFIVAFEPALKWTGLDKRAPFREERSWFDGALSPHLIKVALVERSRLAPALQSPTITS